MNLKTGKLETGNAKLVFKKRRDQALARRNRETIEQRQNTSEKKTTNML